MKTILFVCTANICRSPMAAAIMRQRIAASSLMHDVQVLSAGVLASDGDAASRNAVATLASRMVDLAGHRSQPVTSTLLDRADIVLVMEEAHRRSLFYLAPQHLAKVFLLAEMVGRHDDVADPYGWPREVYEQTVDLLEKWIDQGLPAILNRIGVARGNGGEAG